jgi:hypothetical protein
MGLNQLDRGTPALEIHGFACLPPLGLWWALQFQPNTSIEALHRAGTLLGVRGQPVS